MAVKTICTKTGGRCRNCAPDCNRRKTVIAPPAATVVPCPRCGGHLYWNFYFEALRCTQCEKLAPENTDKE